MDEIFFYTIIVYQFGRIISATYFCFAILEIILQRIAPAEKNLVKSCMKKLKPII